MKKVQVICLMLLFSASASAQAWHRVNVRFAPLRKGPRAFTRIKTRLIFGTFVRIRGKAGQFYRVQSKKGSGFIHRSAVIDNKRFQKYYSTFDKRNPLPSVIKEPDIWRRRRSGKARYDLVKQIFQLRRNSFLWYKEFRRKRRLGEFK